MKQEKNSKRLVRPPFAWDVEMFIGSVCTEDNKHKYCISLTRKNGKGYVSLAKHVALKDGFKFVKGLALPISKAQQIALLIDRAYNEGIQQGYDLQQQNKD